MSKKPGWPVKTAVSAGGIVYKIEDGKIFLVLVSPRHNVWTLPKGLVEEESIRETALREVKEEAGITGEIEIKLGQIDYWFAEKNEKVRIHKYVHYFLIKYTSGDISDHDSEIEKVCWVAANQVEKCLTYPTDKKIIKKALAYLKTKYPELFK